MLSISGEQLLERMNSMYIDTCVYVDTLNAEQQRVSAGPFSEVHSLKEMVEHKRECTTRLKHHEFQASWYTSTLNSSSTLNCSSTTDLASRWHDDTASDFTAYIQP